MRERIGVDVILPLAAMLPFERHVTWARRQEIPAKVARELAENAGTIGTGAMALAMFGARHRLPGRLGLISTALATVVPLLSKDMVQDAASLAGEKLRGVHDRALEKKQSLAAILTGFKIDLERAEREGVLRRSRR